MFSRLLALFILFTLVGAGVYYWHEGSDAPADLRVLGRALREVKTTAQIKAALKLNRHLSALNLDVSVAEGVAWLRGTAPSEDVRRLATQVVGAVPGVRRVANHMQVVPGTPATLAEGRTFREGLDDRALEVKIRLALSLNARLEGSRVDVRVYRREVTLTGEVASPAQRGVVLAVVRDIPKVRAVVDRLGVRGGRASASTGHETVERALAQNEHLSRYAIRVRDQQGRLRLTGRVATGAEKSLAGLLAREAASGPVENALKVGPDRNP